MTTLPQETILVYPRNDTTNSYLVTFSFEYPEQVLVYINTTNSLVEATKLVYGIDYEVTVDVDGGHVALSDPSSLEFNYVYIIREVEYSQPLEASASYSKVNSETRNDWNNYQIQQLWSYMRVVFLYNDEIPPPSYPILPPNDAGRLVAVYQEGSAQLIGTPVVDGRNGSIYCGANLEVTGRGSYTEDVLLKKALKVEGNTTLEGTLGVTGKATVTTLTSTGLITAHSLDVTNDAIIRKKTTTETLAVTLNATIGDIPVKSEKVTESGNLDVAGTATVEFLTVNQSMNSKGTASFEKISSSDLATFHSLKVENTANIEGTLTGKGASFTTISTSELATLASLQVNTTSKFAGNILDSIKVVENVECKILKASLGLTVGPTPSIQVAIDDLGNLTASGDITTATGTVSASAVDADTVSANTVSGGDIVGNNVSGNAISSPLFEFGNEFKSGDVYYKFAFSNTAAGESLVFQEGADSTHWTIINQLVTGGGGGGEAPPTGIDTLTSGYVPRKGSSVLIDSAIEERGDDVIFHKRPVAVDIGLVNITYMVALDLTASENLTTNQTLVFDFDLGRIEVGSYNSILLHKTSPNTAVLQLHENIESGPAIVGNVIAQAPLAWVGHGDQIQKDLYCIPEGTITGSTITGMKFSHVTYVSEDQEIAHHSIGSTSLVIDYTDYIQVTYSDRILQILINNMPTEGGMVIEFVKDTSDPAPITWPSDWIWPEGVAPITTNWAEGVPCQVALVITGGIVLATVVFSSSNAKEEAMEIVGSVGFECPLMWVGTSGYRLASNFTMEMTGDIIYWGVWPHVTFNATYGLPDSVTINSGTLSMDLTQNYKFIATHDSDITTLELLVDSYVLGSNFEATLYLEPGLSTQTSVPLPPGWFSTNRTWELNPGILNAMTILFLMGDIYAIFSK